MLNTIYQRTTESKRNYLLKFQKHWNRLKFRLTGVQFGKDLNVFGTVRVSMQQRASITIGDTFVFKSGQFLNPLSRNIAGCICAEHDASIIIGNNVGISSACIWAHKSIVIGNYVNIGGDSILMDSDAHSLDYLLRMDIVADLKNTVSLPIVIGDNVLIGARCIILKGVRIGSRSIIGSGSVVTKDIPEDCIAAGNPARIIKRLQEETKTTAKE